MSYIFSRALVEAFSPASFSGTDASAPSNGSPTHRPCLWHDRTMEPSRLFRFGMTCERLTDDRGAVLLMSWLAVSRVRTSAQPETATASTASAPGFGAKWPASSVRYDPATSSWKTAHCLWDEDLPWSSVILPTWGMTRSGFVYRHPTAERPISGIGAGLWPTPTVCGNYNRKGASATSGDGLATAVSQWPTPNARDYKGAPGAGCVERGGRQSSLPQAVKTRTWPTATATAYKGWSPNHNRADTDDRLDYSVERESFQPGQQTPPMRLNPEWVELLMGWPKGFTSLEPLPRDEFDAWFEGFSGQGLRDMRQGIQSTSDAKWPPARREIVSCAEALQPRMRQQQEGIEAAKLSVARPETSEGCVRSMRPHETSGGPSLRSGSDKQRSSEPADVVQPLPRLLARYGQEAWQDGSWENAVPRVTAGMPHRAHRIKALGNGQVPRVAAAAFAALSSD